MVYYSDKYNNPFRVSKLQSLNLFPPPFFSHPQRAHTRTRRFLQVVYYSDKYHDSDMMVRGCRLPSREKKTSLLARWRAVGIADWKHAPTDSTLPPAPATLPATLLPPSPLYLR